MKQPTDSNCNMCYKVEEHIKHTVVGCTTFAPSEYTNSHNKIAGYIHWTIYKHYHRSNNTSKPPDIVPRDKKEKTGLLINIAIPDDSNGVGKQVPRPEDCGQQDVGSENKNCASYNWSIRNN